MVARIIVAGIIGGVIGYGFFYFRYENRELVNELRKSLKTNNEELQHLRTDYAEYEQQNIILKRKVKELLQKNTDLAKVVGELSRYYYNIKVGAEKIHELAEFLSPPDQDIVNQIKQYAPEDVIQNIEKDEAKQKTHKKDFF